MDIIIKTENLSRNCVTDEKRPSFSFSIISDKQNVELEGAEISVGSWKIQTTEQIAIEYGGEPLRPFTEYKVKVRAENNHGETAEATSSFSTGRLGTPWTARWITDGKYKFTARRVSPVPMVFRKNIKTDKKIASAVIYSTAMGIYEIALNGQKVGEDYFAPGFTSYKSSLQYQTYDVTGLLTGDDELIVNVAGGWAVGSFVFTRKNRISADRQALLLELRITYADGSQQVIGTDKSWLVCEGGHYRMADFYDGEEYDATVNLDTACWRRAVIEKPRCSPQLTASYGAPVRAHEVMRPIGCTVRADGELIYDFGQNFAGVIVAKIKGERGKKVIFRHAEVLDSDGALLTKLLRSAKATATYICDDGVQTYSPRLTYMGFRYVGVTGIEKKNLELTAVALYSDMENGGSFECSSKLINKLQSNITWSAKSNFVDIPTDCPQRDERMGWTGDIAVFASTACYNFDTTRFLGKWLKDLRAEQIRTGGIPNCIPIQGYGFPATMPKKAIAFWGDACVFVPWAMYLAYGDKRVLEQNYGTMKRYLKAERFWAGFGLGKNRYIWNDIPMLQFGDWLAPDVKTMGEWQKRCRWTGTAAIAASSGIMEKIATILGKPKDALRYKRLHDKVSEAYVSVFTDGRGKLKNEFQTAYVLPLYFDMFPEDMRIKAAVSLRRLVERNGNKIGTGFPGTPYILFALADNGQAETAFNMLNNTECPSWLYEVKAGATTIWEHWDAIREDGTINGGEDDGTGGMSSFNHYASGAVGDFLYKRIAGIVPLEAGYKRFMIKPLIGGGLTYARGCVNTPYGEICSEWKTQGQRFSVKIRVPACTECDVYLPNGESIGVGSGEYEFTARL